MQPRTLFLCDSAGALVTALLLVLVLAPFEHIFGMPKNVLFLLSLFAIAISINSFRGYLKFKDDWKSSLRIVVGLNLGYCCITIALVIFHYPYVKLPGLIYFVLETFVICILSWMECRYIDRSR